MSEETQNVNEQQPDGQENPEATQPEEKTLTQAEVNAIVAREKTKAAKAAKAEYEAERKKAEMSESERLRADLEEREKRISELEAKHQEANQRVQLAGKVADLDYAMFKIQQAGDKYLSSDGSVHVDAFLKDFEGLRAQPTPKPGPAPTTSGGSTVRPHDMNNAIRQRAGRS